MDMVPLSTTYVINTDKTWFEKKKTKKSKKLRQIRISY